MGTQARENVTEDVYIKGKKIGPGDYRNLATFFNEEITDPKLWNAVLHSVAGSPDTNVRRMMLSVVLDDGTPHEKLKHDSEAVYRAWLLIHDMKAQTGFARAGWRAKRARLAVGRFVRSKNLLLFLTFTCIVVIFTFFIYSEAVDHSPGIWSMHRTIRMFSR